MSVRVRYERRRGVWSLALLVALALGASAFAWIVLGSSIDKWFTALAGAISRAGS